MSDDALAPIGDRIVFENAHVRVWENVVEPGGESPVHRHDHDYLVIDLEGERLVHNPIKDGEFPRMEYDVTPGAVIPLNGGVTETAINVGSTRYRGLLVEFLDSPR
jgi:quercetin dioxygenase-like cupin family protein